MLKRFRIETQTMKTCFKFIREEKDAFLDFVTLHQEPVVALRSGKKGAIAEEEVALHENADVTGLEIRRHPHCRRRP